LREHRDAARILEPGTRTSCNKECKSSEIARRERGERSARRWEDREALVDREALADQAADLAGPEDL
jgi:hypothetical protein